MRKLLLAALTMLMLSPTAVADKNEAETCLRTKIWDGYNEGWAVRTAVTAELKEGAHRIYLVTLYAGNEYRFDVCGDPNVKDVDLILHDANGKEMMRDKSKDREPQLSYKPKSTDTFYVAVYASKLEPNVPNAGVSMAVTYR